MSQVNIERALTARLTNADLSLMFGATGLAVAYRRRILKSEWPDLRSG